jgi:hypothetical protein
LPARFQAAISAGTPSYALFILKEAPVDKALLTFTKVVGTAALLTMGYTLISALPDSKRYLRIGDM